MYITKKGDTMAEYTKETVTSEEGDSQPTKTPKRESTASQTTEYIVYFLFGLLDILLAFRLVLRLLGANPISSFVSFIYSLSAAFIWPFQGIFQNAVSKGVETTAVFEPETLIAIIVYAIVAWGIVQLIRILSGNKPE